MNVTSLLKTLGQCIDNLTSTVDNFASEFAQVESYLVVTKIVNNELLARITLL